MMGCRAGASALGTAVQTAGEGQTRAQKGAVSVPQSPASRQHVRAVGRGKGGVVAVSSRRLGEAVRTGMVRGKGRFGVEHWSCGACPPAGIKGGRGGSGPVVDKSSARAGASDGGNWMHCQPEGLGRTQATLEVTLFNAGYLWSEALKKHEVSIVGRHR